ncbi:MAG: hypothetical protein LBQ24_02540 [Candidatus Peribacteria bacterium]|jgi:hypothetical protein|nr:hypothetical protein [Candidatus Peribacteria bacterium]
MKQNFDVIDALRITDVRFFMKKFTKKKNEEDYKALEKFEEELIQYYRNKQLEEIEYFKEL